MKKDYKKFDGDALTIQDQKLVVELGKESVLIETNENKTTISVTDNTNYKENPFKSLGIKSAVQPKKAEVSYKKVYSKTTYESSYTLWNQNSVVYKYNQAANEPA